MSCCQAPSSSCWKRRAAALPTVLPLPIRPPPPGCISAWLPSPGKGWLGQKMTKMRVWTRMRLPRLEWKVRETRRRRRKKKNPSAGPERRFLCSHLSELLPSLDPLTKQRRWTSRKISVSTMYHAGFRNSSLLILQNTFANLSFSELPERLLRGIPVPWQFQRGEGDSSARDCPRLGLVVPPLPVAALGGVLKGKN